jgi:tetratricopeptide (TPR) repeat protein/transglutaminase-like putative cysteine protease
MSRFTWLAAVFLLTCPLLALAKPVGPTAEAAQTSSERALELASSPRGAAHLIRMHGLIEELEDITPLASTYAQIASRRSADPGTRATAAMLLMDVERARGRTVRAAEVQRSLGFIGDFYIVGSFENEGKSGCDIDYGPEAATVDLAARFAGTKGREVSWHKLAVAPTDGYVDMASVVRPTREAVAYALTWLEAPEETRVALGVGTSGGFRLWVNGQPVAREDRYNLPRPDQTRVSVRLRKGLNRVLLKVCQETGPLGFYLRQEQQGGRGVVRAVLPATPPALERGVAPAPQMLPTITSTLRELVNKKPDDAQLRGEYATVLSFFRAYDEREYTAMVESERAARAAPEDVGLQLLAASNQRDDLNLRRHFLEAAMKAAPDSASARVALAEHELDRGHPERVPALLTPVVEKSPESAAAWLTLARAYETLGETARAHLMVEETFRRLPGIPRVVRAAAANSRKLERQQEVLDRLRVALALRYDDSPSRRMLAAQLADSGKVEESAQEYARQLVLNPFDNDSRVRLAELRASNGQLEAATRHFAEAKALSPDEPEVYEREGRALLAAGQREEALATFERSLALRPQNPGLKETVRTLKGETSDGSRHLIDITPLIKEADAYPNEDAVYVAENTFVRVQKNGLQSRLHQMVIKMVNQRGVDTFRTWPLSYSPDRQELRVLRARVIKPDGSVVEGYGETERHMNEPWTGMYYDARAKMLNFPALAPGDVLELVHQIDDTSTENLLSDYYGDVEHVLNVYPKVHYQFLVDMPKERPLYSNTAQLPGVKHTREEQKDGRVLYRWTSRNVAKVIPEPGMPGWTDVVTPLHVSTYRTHEEVARYWWGLVRDQLTPTDEVRQTVDQVLAGVDRKNEMAVVEAIYSFVVKNTRYVALEFGIHGYKPYRVDRVLARRFGDCKDKASLIHTMLKIAGVDSRMVLLRMRSLGSLAQEPASLAAFNHAIVYVPKFQMFLDGTAESHGPRELPSADRMANVIIVEPEGKSTFLTTPEAKAEDNATLLTMDVALKPDGSAVVLGASTVSGQQAPEYRRAYGAAATRKSTFERAWAQSFPGLTVNEVKLSDITRLTDNVSMDFQMSIPRYAEVLQGKELRFLPFGTGRTYQQAYAAMPERRFDLQMQSPWMNRFTLRYTLPAGYTVAELPPAMEEEMQYGRVKLSYRMEGGKLIADGELILPKARIKVEDYHVFRAFLGRVDRAFGRKVVLKPAAGQTATR